MSKIKIICTLGPSSFKKDIIDQLKKNKVNLLRINLSHTKSEEIQKRINFLKKNKVKNICIDTEGAQIRTSFIKKEIFYKKNKKIKIICGQNKSDKKKIYLQPFFKFDKIKKNCVIDIGFSNLSLKVIKNYKDKNYILCKTIKSGFLGANKGVHINADIELPSLSEKDLFAINLMKRNNINNIAISFVNKVGDVTKVRQLLGKKCYIISKIETKNALKNLKSISNATNALLIDRGDLSREVPVQDIPLVQEKILKHSNKIKKPTYVATNLLETMIKQNLPTRAESNDIYASLNQGAKGMVLAAETAIGIDPINCVKFLKKCIKSFINKKKLSKSYRL
tara:strand:+ start:2692 stop:3702 length:1011 start_codon:yes stop_codon:yes gene_type:complete